MCHHHRYRDRYEARRELDPRPSRSPAPRGPIRAGDADRERVVEALRMHAGAGRLDADELERRIEAAYAATYISDLDAALAELPALPRSDARPSRRGSGSPNTRVLTLLAAIAALVVVTSLTGVYALWWLMWPVAVALRPHRVRRRLPAAG
jgi:hypothetical protein